MDAAASLNPLRNQHGHYPVSDTRTAVSVSGGDGRAAPERTPAPKDPIPRGYASTPSVQYVPKQAGSPFSAGQLQREGYSYGAQVALRSYYAAADADVEIHRVDTYA